MKDRRYRWRTLRSCQVCVIYANNLPVVAGSRCSHIKKNPRWAVAYLVKTALRRDLRAGSSVLWARETETVQLKVAKPSFWKATLPTSQIPSQIVSSEISKSPILLMNMSFIPHDHAGVACKWGAEKMNGTLIESFEHGSSLISRS